uniref:Uncharacterized protein n=1 Tax=Hippobroma longiflora TaxID=368676 RepID=A0A1Z2QTE1_9ASTR|nr:hypothetical protein Hi_lon1Pt0318 [Hippobroma longiflora]ASA34744.1 hypothetical protein Hi_lon1Pt0318 [Hippobroma longiflora]
MVLIQSLVSFGLKITNSVVGVGLHYGFFTLSEIAGHRGKWMSLYNRPLHLANRKSRKSLCCTKGGTLPSDNNEEDFIFFLLCVQMTPQKIVSNVWKQLASQNGDPGGRIIDFAQTLGASFVAKRKQIFFRNAKSIEVTKACLWVQLQSSFLEKMDEKQYDITVGFWSGAWKHCLFESKETGSDTTSNLDLVARESLRVALQKRIRNKPSSFQDYAPYVHAWLQVRSDFLHKLAILDKCDARYQKYHADNLIIKAINEFFRAPYWLREFFRNFRWKEDKYALTCWNLVADKDFTKRCFKVEDLTKDLLDSLSICLDLIAEEDLINKCFGVSDEQKELQNWDFELFIYENWNLDFLANVEIGYWDYHFDLNEFFSDYDFDDDEE